MTDGTVQSPTFGVECPACHVNIDIPVTARIEDNEFTHLGMANLVLEPDTTDLWAHMWTHENHDDDV